MANLGFNKHQKEAAIRCMEKNPNQLKDMSKKAHELYPDLAIRWLKSGRNNSPYLFMDCKFDSKEEREFCNLLMKLSLIKKPEEGKNVHINIGKSEIDFLVNGDCFIEYSPPVRYGNKEETIESYYKIRRN